MLRFSAWLGGCALAAGLILSAPATALDAIVEKKVFELPSYTTTGGATIRNLRIG